MLMARDHLVEYLQQTLIPDLIESGREASAEDFGECVRHITNLANALEVAKATIERLANTPPRLASVQGTLSVIAEAIEGSTGLRPEQVAEFQ